MAAVLRLARGVALVPVLPAIVSWILLFGYQWAFFLAYHGSQPTVFSYYSGVLGDGLFMPAVNVAAFLMLRRLSREITWRRLPLYVVLGFATAGAAFLMQAHLDLVNWSMPRPFVWSGVGRFHFLIMWAEISYLYFGMATSINNWKLMRTDRTGWWAFWIGWACLALFAITLVADYVR